MSNKSKTESATTNKKQKNQDRIISVTDKFLEQHKNKILFDDKKALLYNEETGIWEEKTKGNL